MCPCCWWRGSSALPITSAAAFRAFPAAGAAAHVAPKSGSELKTHFSFAGLINVQQGYVLNRIYSAVIARNQAHAEKAELASQPWRLCWFKAYMEACLDA